jgi:hypothetical protein
MTIAAHMWGFVFATLALASIVAGVRAWRCPRCHERFAGAGLRSWPHNCAFCGLEEFAAPEDIHAPIEVVREDARRLSPRVQRWVAVGQMLCGAAAMLLSGIYSSTLPWWNVWLLESIGFISVYAGWRLWRDEPEGFPLTRALQWLQLVGIQGHYGAFTIASGFQVNLMIDRGNITLSPGIWAYVFVQSGTFPFSFRFNVLAAFLLVVLWGAQSGKRVRVSARAKSFGILDESKAPADELRR